MDLNDLLSQSGDEVGDDLQLLGAFGDEEEVSDAGGLSDVDGSDPFEVAPALEPVSQASRQPDPHINDAEGIGSSSSLPSQAAARKRKAAPAAKRTPLAKRRRTSHVSSSSPLAVRSKAARFTKPMTARFMRVLAECKADGLLNPTNSKHWGPVWEKLVSTLSSEFPQYRWSKQIVMNKYNTEKKRHNRFITFLAYSGTSYDEESGLVQGTDEHFEAINKKFNNAGWLRATPLGDREVYDDVFWRERATGEEIDAVSVDEAVEEEDVTTDDGEGSASTQTGRRRRVREDSGDPDLALANGSASTLPAIDEVPVIAVRRRGQERLEDALSNSMEGLASQLTKMQGEDAVQKASLDLQNRFGGRNGQPSEYSPDVVISCLEKMAITPMLAVIWNTMTEAAKSARMERWAREMGSG